MHDQSSSSWKMKVNCGGKCDDADTDEDMINQYQLGTI